MSHFLLIPTNENGILIDTCLVQEVEKAGGASAFAFNHLFVYSHGWWTTANHAMNEYNRFSLEFAEFLTSAMKITPPSSSLAMGVHWPSMLSEDDASPEN